MRSGRLVREAELTLAHGEETDFEPGWLHSIIWGEGVGKMRRSEIAILLMAGAFSGDAVMKVWDRPRIAESAPKVARVMKSDPAQVSSPSQAVVVTPPPLPAPEPQQVKPPIQQQRTPAKAARKYVPPRRVAPPILAKNQPARAHDLLMDLLAARPAYDGSARVVSFTDGDRPQAPVVLLQIVILQSRGSTLRYQITAANPFSDEFGLVDLLKQLTDTVSLSKCSACRGKVADSCRDW